MFMRFVQRHSTDNNLYRCFIFQSHSNSAEHFIPSTSQCYYSKMYTLYGQGNLLHWATFAPLFPLTQDSAEQRQVVDQLAETKSWGWIWSCNRGVQMCDVGMELWWERRGTCNRIQGVHVQRVTGDLGLSHTYQGGKRHVHHNKGMTWIHGGSVIFSHLFLSLSWTGGAVVAS